MLLLPRMRIRCHPNPTLRLASSVLTSLEASVLQWRGKEFDNNQPVNSLVQKLLQLNRHPDSGPSVGDMVQLEVANSSWAAISAEITDINPHGIHVRYLGDFLHPGTQLLLRSTEDAAMASVVWVAVVADRCEASLSLQSTSCGK